MSWKDATKELFETVSSKKQSLVLYFGSSDDDLLSKIDFAEYVNNGLVTPVALPKPEADSNKEPVENAKRSRVPGSKLKSDDLWKAYGVNKAKTFVITDCYGNETGRTASTKITKYLVKVGKSTKKKRGRVEELTDEAQEAMDEDDTKSAIQKLHKAFEESLVGYAESEQAKKLYSKLMESGRAKLKNAKDDIESLEVLESTFSNSDLDSEIRKAITDAKASD